MKEQHIKINFTASGYIDQDILITDDYTPEEVIIGLQNENIITSVQEGGELVDVTDGAWKVIGTVVSTESSLEHRHFDSVGNYELVAKPTKNFNASKMALQMAVGEVIGDSGDLSCDDIMIQLMDVNDRVASDSTNLDIVEQFELLTGAQLVTEILTVEKGLKSLMQVAYNAGKNGDNFI